MRIYKRMVFKKLTALLIVFLVTLVISEDVNAGEQASSNIVYIDSVEAGAGDDVAVRINLENMEMISSISVPVKFDTSLLTLKSISFTGSRGEHLSSKIISPPDILTANGHFVVAMIRWLEDPIPIGNGMIFTVLFHIADTAPVGAVATIDTLFYPPGGILQLVEADSALVVAHEFRAGKVVVGALNRSPKFESIPAKFVLEGDTLTVNIKVSDPDNNSISLAATNKPSGAIFTDNGDGTGRMEWVPNYLGPNSSDLSPITLNFWASDGSLSVEQSVIVNVINRNRAPEITAPADISVEAGQEMNFSISAIDPDFEVVSWSWSGLPTGATFSGGNPASIVWQSSVTDTSSFGMQFIASDPNGLADTVLVTGVMSAISLYTLSLDSVVVFPNEDFDYNIFLDNKLSVSGFNLLFNYDPTAFSLVSIHNLGTRTEAFEYFVSQTNDNSIPGNVRIRATANVGGTTPSLVSGNGSVAVVRLHTTGNLAFAGLSIPVNFKFLDAPTNDDNTLTNSEGNKVYQTDTKYINGQVMIRDLGQIKIGDINLNGLAAEIGDVIYFTNYFINPILYSFNVIQYANSDVNQDNVAASVSDLVALINIVVNGTSPGQPKDAGFHSEATLATTTLNDQVEFSYLSDVEVGGVLVVIDGFNVTDNMIVTNYADGITLDYNLIDNELKILLYSLNGKTLPSGNKELFSISGLNQFNISRMEFASSKGETMEVALAAEATTLPNDFELEQNYPNPFNPTTTIAFSLPQVSRIELTIYNVLGQQVKQLAGEDYPAGSYSLVWDGRDDNGRAVASGVYLYRLDADGKTFTKKMMMLK